MFWGKVCQILAKPSISRQPDPAFTMEQQALKNVNNERTCIRHQFRKTTVLRCRRCVINTGVEKLTTLKYRL
jgi:hypothetical protein